MTYTFVSVPKKSNAGAVKPKLANLCIFRINDAETFPKPDASGIEILEALVLKTGATAINIEATVSSINVNQTTDGEVDAKGTKQKIEFSRPGTTDKEWEEFVQNNQNEDLACIVQYVDQDVKKLAGYPGNPLQMQVESTDNNEGDTNKVTLESLLKGRRISFYKGAMPVLDSGSGGTQSA